MKGVDFEVSATTTMSRVGPLVQTIEDLAEKQVIQPTSYNIYCSKKVARLVSRRLSSRFSKLIKVKVRDDAGPATKAIYHLESQEVPLVTVDDDVFYDKYLFLRLLQNHERSPKAVISDRVHRVSHSKAGLLKPYLEWSREVENTHEASHNLFLTGVGGVLYPKKSMHPDACDIKLQNKLAFYVDDVWWWVQALRMTIKKVWQPKLLPYPKLC